MVIKKRLKIAVLIKRFIATGGAERYAVEVTRRLLGRGHRIDLYARQVENSLTGGIRVVTVPDRLRFSSVLNSWSFAKESARLLLSKKYDVILSHERGYCQDLSTIHTFSYQTGMEKCSFFKKLNSIYLSPRSWLHLRLERQQMQSAWLVPVSNTVKEGINRYYGRTENTVIATPGVDIEWFNPVWVEAHRDKVRSEERIEPDELAVLFVGSEFKRKGLDDVIRAISPGMKLLVVGRGERSGYYHRLAEKCGVGEQVSFKGLTDDVRHCYAAADVVVLPSLREAFGMSILEAMACGLPVISSAATGVAALIENGKNGFIFTNAEKIGELLNKLKSADLKLAMGKQARSTAENHTWEETAAIYEKICLEITEGKAANRRQPV